jgi:hypothetical protein
MEFFLEKTLAQFNHAGSRLNWNWPELFSEFEHVLGDSYHTTWAEVLNEHFPEPLEEASTYSHDKKEGFKQAIELFITKILNNKKPRDLQYIYMAPEGDYSLARDLLTLPRLHLHHFKEMLHIAKLPPAGDIPKPSDKLALQWYYMSYHKSDHKKFVLSRKRLTTRPSSPSQPFFGLSSSRKCLMLQSNAKRRILSTSVSIAKLRRSSADRSARPLTAGAASVPDARSLFAMIDAAMSPTKEIGAVVIILTTIAVATTAAPPMEC